MQRQGTTLGCAPLPRTVKPLRILHSEPSLELGGQEFRVLAEAAGMKRRGHSVIVALQPESKVSAYALRCGLRVVSLRMRQPRCANLVREFLALIRTHHIDLLNTHGSIDSWTASLAGRLSAPKPVIVRTRHKSTPISKTFRHRLLYRHLPHGIVTTSESIREQIIRHQGVAPSRIVTIPTGVDLKVYRPRDPDLSLKEELGIPPDAVLVGAIAFLWDYKGLDDFIAAARLISQHVSRARFLLVGDGPEQAALVHVTVTLGLSDRVTFTGFREDIPRILSVLDVVVLPSVAGEGTPQALLQAMAMERPVVATAVGGIPEFVKHQETGLLTPVKHPQALAEHVLLLLRDRALCKRIGQSGRELVVKSYDLDRMLDRIEAFYEALHKEAGTRTHQIAETDHVEG